MNPFWFDSTLFNHVETSQNQVLMAESEDVTCTIKSSSLGFMVTVDHWDSQDGHWQVNW